MLKRIDQTDDETTFASAGDRRVETGREVRSIPNRGPRLETLEIGGDAGSPVTEGDAMPYDFSGKPNSLKIKLDSTGQFPSCRAGG